MLAHTPYGSQAARGRERQAAGGRSVPSGTWRMAVQGARFFLTRTKTGFRRGSRRARGGPPKPSSWTRIMIRRLARSYVATAPAAVVDTMRFTLPSGPHG